MALDKILYTAQAHVTGGRTGQATAKDGAIDLKLDTPKELGGQGGPGTNPEQLFAAGYSACFIGALGAVAGKHKVTLPEDTNIEGEVGIGPSDKGFEIAVELKISLPGLDAETADKLIQAAHQVCPYSNATRGNVDVTLTRVD